MSQALIETNDISSGRFQVKGPEAHHLIRVLRKKVNDEVELTDGHGHRYKGKITTIDSSTPQVDGNILVQLFSAPRQHSLHLFQGLPKGSKFDYVIEKATELGVDSIHPFLSEKNIVKLDSKQSAGKLERWKKLVVSASKQSERSTLTHVEPVKNIFDLGSQLKKGFSIVLDPKSNTKLKDVCKKIPSAGEVNIIIGPESGFTEKEASWMKNEGVFSVSLGERILRTETAGLVALSILNYQLDLF